MIDVLPAGVAECTEDLPVQKICQCKVHTCCELDQRFLAAVFCTDIRDVVLPCLVLRNAVPRVCIRIGVRVRVRVHVCMYMCVCAFVDIYM